MLVDWQQFSCQTCAQAPHLQAVQGCFKPAPRVFFRLLDEYEFTRCPVRYQSKASHMLAAAAREGVLDSASYKDKVSMPAKRLAALRYLDTILKAANRDD